MKKHYRFLMMLAAIACAVACQKNGNGNPEPEPEPEPEPLKYIFIVEGGDGDGSSWEKAGGIELFRSLLAANDQTTQEDILVNDMTVAFASGTYVLPTAQDTVKVGYPDLSYKFAIEGGFDVESTGTDVSKKTGTTIFSGDVDRDAAANDNKPIILMDGDVDLLIKDVKFTDGNLEDTDGAAIQAVSGKVSLEGCVFDNNKAHRAGAIYVGAAEVVANNCVFSNCSSSNHGGVLMTNDENAKLTFTDCTFTKCKAGGNSGVMNLGSGSLLATRCVFDANTLTGSNNSPIARINKWLNNTDEGDPVKAKFVECEFRNNVNPGATWQYSAGCFALGKADVEFDGCKWTNNKAFRGAAFTTVHSEANVIVKNSTFKGNTTSSHGSVFNNEAADTHVTFQDCLFEENEAADQGLFYADHKTSYFFASGCTFKNNSAKNGSIAGNYANRAQSTLHFDNCYFEGNHQASRALFIGATNMCYMLNNCQFYNNYNTDASSAWGIITHSASLVCANGLTVYNEASMGEMTAFGSDLDVLVVNTSVVLPARGTEKGLLRSNAHKVIMANNILIKPEGTSMVEDASAVKTFGHNVYGPAAGSKFVPAASDYLVPGESALGNASFDVEKKAYVWDGPSVLNGFTAASKAEILSAIAEHNALIDGKNVGEEFRAWLESLPGKPLDRSYTWPGAYVK